MPEIWKNIKDYEGLYQVSNLGRVKRIWKTKENICTPILQNEYYYINLCKHKKSKRKLLHRLVAQACKTKQQWYGYHWKYYKKEGDYDS